jgi:hypothetical protein
MLKAMCHGYYTTFAVCSTYSSAARGGLFHLESRRSGSEAWDKYVQGALGVRRLRHTFLCCTKLGCGISCPGEAQMAFSTSPNGIMTNGARCFIGRVGRGSWDHHAPNHRTRQAIHTELADWNTHPHILWFVDWFWLRTQHPSKILMPRSFLSNITLLPRSITCRVVCLAVSRRDYVLACSFHRV